MVLILDATASQRGMWLNKNDPEAIYIDERRAVEPDVICVWAYLPFKSKIFTVDNFDPPHMLYEVTGKPSFLKERFGLLKRDTWEKDLRNAFFELLRVLKDDGSLLMKWNDNHITVKRLLACLPIAPKFKSQVGGSRGFRSKHSTQPRSVTAWFCFTKPSFWFPEFIQFWDLIEGR